jgi:hypothetical protein
MHIPQTDAPRPQAIRYTDFGVDPMEGDCSHLHPRLVYGELIPYTGKKSKPR